MQKVKRRIFSGVVCEQEVFCISDRIKDIKQASPRLRFKNEEEREKHREGISRRKHARKICSCRFICAEIPCLIHGNLSLKQSCRRVSPDAHKDAVA